MLRFILTRLLQAIPVLFIIATLTFFMVRFAPGDPFTDEKTVPAEIRKKLEEHYGLDRPLREQCDDGARSVSHFPWRRWCGFDWQIDCDANCRGALQ